MSLYDNGDIQFVKLPTKLSMKDAMQALEVGLGYEWVRMTSEILALGFPPNHTLPHLIAILNEFAICADKADVRRLQTSLKAMDEGGGVIL